MTLWERLKYSMVRPDDDPKEEEVEEIRPVEEIEADIARSNDKERAIGLVAAPVAALIGLIISSASINYAKTHDQSVSVYDKLTYVLLGLALLVLITSLVAQAPLPGHHPGALWPGDLPAPLHLLRLRRPLPVGRRLVSGAGLPSATGAQAGRGGRPRRAAAKGNTAAAPRPRRNKRYTPPS